MIIYQYKIYDNESNEIIAMKESANAEEIASRIETLNQLAGRELTINELENHDTF
jgi:hypothetical protein